MTTKTKTAATWSWLALTALVTAALLIGIVQRAAAAGADVAQSVLTYHGDANRDGSYVMPALTWDRARGMHRDPAFDGRVDGHIYAQPLFWQSPKTGRQLLIVATEDDTVYALDAHTGKVVWQKSLGRAVERSALPCGNISPLGITGTPVIDEGKGAIYLDAIVATEDSGPQHLVFGLALDDGAIVRGYPMNVATALRSLDMKFTPSIQNQRGALAIVGRTLFVPYGGHYGDCGPYHGWVVGIGLDDPPTITAWSTRAEGGGIWAPGGLSYDGRSLFAATGNTKDADEWADGEAIVRLGPDLKRSTNPHDFFAPANWKMLDDNDEDIGGTSPLPIDVPDSAGVARLLLALGKDGNAYLLSRDNLAGIGGALVVKQVARRPIITAPAVYPAVDGAMAAFAGYGSDCPKESSDDSLVVLKIQAHPSPQISTAWCGAVEGRGSPIVTTTGSAANAIVWMVGAEGDNRLHGFRGDTGAPVFVGSDAMEGLRHFATILAADGRFYIAGDDEIYAFTP